MTSARRLLSLVLAWLTVVAVLEPSLPLVARVIIGGIFAFAIWNPAEGLLLAAGLAPIGALIAAVFDVGPFRLTEAIVVAFFAGSLLRGWPAPSAGSNVWSPFGPLTLESRRPTVAAPWYATRAAWLLAAMAVASVAGILWQLSHVRGALAAVARPLLWSYYTAIDRSGVIEGAKLAEGLGLAAATIVLFRRRPALAVQIPAVLGASAFCAAVAGLLVWQGVGPLSLLQEQARTGYRASHIGDMNAAGSYFVMTLCLALGMSVRERGTGRALWLAAVVACAIGLWLTTSRTAFASAGIVLPLAAAWIATWRWKPALRMSALVGLLVGLVALGALRTRALERDPEFRSSNFRVEFTETSLRIIAARPLFGIGIGRYYAESNLFLGPHVAWTYGFENSHNNFLQIASEMGLVGFGLFALWIGGGVAVASRALAIAPRDWRLLGTFAGVVAFLVTCLGGHPLLVLEVGFPFWVQFGLLVALGSSTVLNHAAAPRRRSERATDVAIEPQPARSALWPAAAGAGVLMLMSLTVAALRTPVAPLESRAVDGFYGWETEAGAVPVRFRWSEAYASVFVPGDVARMELPVRIPREELGRAEMGVEISINGIDRGRFLVGERWTMIALDMPVTVPPNDFVRVNLKVDRTWQPATVISGSTDARTVGVQVGEHRVVRRRPFAAIPGS